MKYRTNPKNNEEVSLLGFGAMRLPTLPNGEIDTDEAVKIIRYAIDNGVTYLDTAYVYHGGKSEELIGEVIKDGYREKVTIATKLPLWMINTEEDMETLFNTHLERMGIDYIDYYLAHDIHDGSFDVLKKFDVIAFMQKKKDEGKIKNLGFSSHASSPAFFKEVIDYYDWDFCQIQLNYMDEEHQAGVEGMKYAASKGIPVIIMEPLRGGKLVDVIPGPIQSYWESASVKRSPADWALRWVANFPEVTVILSGMGKIEQVEENIKILSDAEPNTLTEEELEVINKVAGEYRSRTLYGCTACKYCMPCPAEIDIPAIITYRNEAAIYETMDKLKQGYGMFVNPKASACLDCKACEEICPQHLKVSEIMAETVDIYE